MKLLIQRMKAQKSNFTLLFMKKRITIISIGILMALLIGGSLIYTIELSAVSSKSEEVEFVVDDGSTYYSVIPKLKKMGLIRNETFLKFYIKFNKPKGLVAGAYKLNKNMDAKTLVDTLSGNNAYSKDTINITFKEGKNMRSIASVIAKNTNNTEDSVYALLNNKEYLNSLINKYWFIDNSILNEDIYYSLEGYLYPNTYQFLNKNVKVEDIFKTMLDQTDKKLTNYKSELLNNKYSIHEILTLASIVELEGAKSNDRAGIAQVFYNRLNNNMSLGSDVTTYYASKIDFGDRDLYANEINAQNAYNTRSSYLAGKLPVGPICNPSIESINAVLHSENNNYFYFVSDKNGNTYFAKTYSEHITHKNNLIEAGLWYTYD